MKKLLIASIALIIVSALGVGGFLAYKEMQSQHDDNMQSLEQFGFNVLPSVTYEESQGELGAKQLPATFTEDKLTPTQKVIKGLMDDNDKLIAEQQGLRDQIQALQQQVAQLEEYKKLNEHFAPLTLAEEVLAVESQIKTQLVDSSDARRFSNLQIEAMSASVGHEYKKFIGNRRLILSEGEREALIKKYMPDYAFCVGDGIEIAANSPREERLITRFFRQQDASILDSILKSDLETVIKPCQTALFTRLAEYDSPL